MKKREIVRVALVIGGLYFAVSFIPQILAIVIILLDIVFGSGDANVFFLMALWTPLTAFILIKYSNKISTKIVKDDQNDDIIIPDIVDSQSVMKIALYIIGGLTIILVFPEFEEAVRDESKILVETPDKNLYLSPIIKLILGLIILFKANEIARFLDANRKIL
ncbi:MAG: hypothetical protein KAH48_06320 [Chlorobi bacterium]|nr:hypothetical protein [Chlorobiota bacterium]